MTVNAAWTSGYVGDVAYTLGFYPELAPSILNYACLVNGVEGLPLSRKLRYCELGCGRGYGTTLLAAANPDIEFVGIDFNPSHIAEARTLAKRAGIVNVAFFESSFRDAARSNDPRLIEFDIVALHGVYAWVEQVVREDVHEFIRAKLVSGGLAFVSYNTMPGWARMIPVQRLLIEAANRSGGDSLARVSKGADLLKQLIEKSSGFTTQDPVLKERLAKSIEQDKHYLAHEFLASGWKPLFVTETIAALADVKLSYVGSANIAENRPGLCVRKDLLDTVAAAPDVAMRELIKDFAVNKQFRRDVYVKGPQQLSPQEQERRLQGLTFALTSTGQEAPEKMRIPTGEVTANKYVVDAVWRCVIKGARTGAEILSEAAKTGAKPSYVWQLVEMLVHNGIISPGRGDAARVDGSASRRLNETVMELTLSADTHRFLASPVLGSAVRANFLDRIVAPLLVRNSQVDDIKIAGAAFDRVMESGQHLIQHGRPMAKNDENLREVARTVREFREVRLPRWRALAILD